MIGVDFKQPSTWRGLLGLSGLIGWGLSPELRDQIAIAIAAVFFAIELFRNEYATKTLTRPNQPASAVPQPVQQLREIPGLPTRDEAPRPDDGFNDR